MEQATVFLSYSNADEAWRARLQKQLEVLQYEGGLVVWSHREIRAGSEKLLEIAAAIERARLAVLLVSADFLTSELIREVEMPRILDQQRNHDLQVVPVLVRACLWQQVDWLGRMQILPKNGVALAGLAEHEADQSLTEIVLEIRHPAAGSR